MSFRDIRHIKTVYKHKLQKKERKRFRSLNDQEKDLADSKVGRSTQEKGYLARWVEGRKASYARPKRLVHPGRLEGLEKKVGKPAEKQRETHLEQAP